MKKLSIFAVLGLLVLGLAANAFAADIKVSGKWQIEANWRVDNDFLGKGAQNGEDKTFNIEQRMRTAFTFIANENLKGVLDTQIGTGNWGNGLYAVGSGRTPGSATTTGLGANIGGAGNIMLRKGYVDFKWPGTKVNFLVGYQTVSLPAAFGGGSAILDDQVAAAVMVTPITDNVKLLAGYGRLFDSNPSQLSTTSTSTSGTGSSNAADVVFAAVPVDVSGFNITPFAAFAYAGKDAYAQNTSTQALQGTTGTNATNDGARMYWGGVAMTVTALDGFKIMGDFNYGKATWNNRSNNDPAVSNAQAGGRSGWLADIAVDYTGLKFMTPSAFFVYSSGEGHNSTEGGGKSDRMPIVANPQTWAVGSFFFGDRDFVTGFGANDGYIRNNLGFWTAGVSLKDITFLDKLKHTVHVLYVKGTNDKNSIYENGGTTRNTALKYGGYLTEKDSLWEFDLNTKYMIYDELSMYLNLGYISASFDKDLWRNSGVTNAADIGNYGSKDAMRVGLGMTYAF